MEIKRVLVTGSNGFIGSLIVNHLLNQTNVQVFGTSRGRNRNEQLNPKFYLNLNLLDLLGLNSCLENIRPNIVVHCAAISQVDLCEKNQELCRNVNIEATKIISNYCKKFYAKIVFLSTDFVFNGSNKWEDEESQPNPQSIYAKSKYECEKFIQCTNSNWVIIRPVLVYGFSPVAARPNIFSWVYNSVVSGIQINVVDDQMRTPTFVGDVIRLVALSINSHQIGVYNLGGENVISVFEFAMEIERQLRIDHKFVVPTKSAHTLGGELRPINSCFKNLKVKRDFNLCPIGIIEGVAKSIKMIK
ncbi:MAG: SDR family oxidoreductase [Salibacteraceae bacterium]